MIVIKCNGTDHEFRYSGNIKIWRGDDFIYIAAYSPQDGKLITASVCDAFIPEDITSIEGRDDEIKPPQILGIDWGSGDDATMYLDKAQVHLETSSSAGEIPDAIGEKDDALRSGLRDGSDETE
jgi:hypothetical protein